MRLISTDEYNETTMQLARPIYDKYSRVLLAAGRTIHPVYLSKMEQMGIRYLMIEDAVSEGITMEEVIDSSDWMQSIIIMEKVFNQLEQNGKILINELHKLATRLVHEVSIRKTIILFPTSSLALELGKYAHAVNTAVLSLHLAKKKLIAPSHMKDIAIGALIHDIGKIMTKELENHPTEGYNLIKKERDINLLIAHCSYQHHERVDGQGFPRKLQGNQIHEYAQLVSISSMYDNLLSEKKLKPHEAIEYIMTLAGSYFSNELVTLFVNEVPSYIPGTKVILTNDREAIVTQIRGSIQRPFIRYLDTDEELSLVNHPTLFIQQVIEKEIVLQDREIEDKN